MRLLVDSSFVIDYLQSDRAALERWRQAFEAGDEPAVNEVVVSEVRAGLYPHEEPLLETFLEPVEFIRPARHDAMRAGRWRAEARARGRHLSLADALIAAAADDAGAPVLTRNVRGFALTPVRVETY